MCAWYLCGCGTVLDIDHELIAVQWIPAFAGMTGWGCRLRWVARHSLASRVGLGWIILGAAVAIIALMFAPVA